MNINVKYFASIRDLIGKDSEVLNLDDGASVKDLWNIVVVDKHSPTKLLIAVNHEYVDGKYKLKDGDEVAFFPPVTGG
ncbi:MAG: molybdopterin converting factor subunit 1 [Gammaproteobacteria bacterium]|nr:molybdopterin converting factor subunit 1 [Gammaproteobacteria bacterium]